MSRKIPRDVAELKTAIAEFCRRSSAEGEARRRHSGNLFSGESNYTEQRWSGRAELVATMMTSSAEARVRGAFRNLMQPRSIAYWRRRLKTMHIDV